MIRKRSPQQVGRPVEVHDPVRLKLLLPRELVARIEKKYPNIPTAKAIRLALNESCPE